MPGLLAQVLAYTLLPVAATIAGGAIAAFRTPGPRLRSGVQHFAAGVVFAAVAVELLPDVVHERAPVAAVLAFGVAALLYLVTEELLVEAHEVPETAAITSAFFAGFLVLLVIDMVA